MFSLTSYMEPPTLLHQESDPSPNYTLRVPFALLIMAIFLLLPELSWRFWSSLLRLPNSGIEDFYNLWKNSGGRGDISEKSAQLVSVRIAKESPSQYELLSEWRTPLCHIFHLLYFVLIYIIEFLLLHNFLSEESATHPLLMSLDPYVSHPSFPSIYLCSYEIRHQARVHSYIIQCTSTINVIECYVLYASWVVLIVGVLMAVVQVLHSTGALLLCFSTGLNPVSGLLRMSSADGSEGQRRKFLGANGIGVCGCYILVQTSDNLDHSFASELCKSAWQKLIPREGNDNNSMKNDEMSGL